MFQLLVDVVEVGVAFVVELPTAGALAAVCSANSPGVSGRLMLRVVRCAWVGVSEEISVNGSGRSGARLRKRLSRSWRFWSWLELNGGTVAEIGMLGACLISGGVCACLYLRSVLLVYVNSVLSMGCDRS